jgi:hypothetical protein
MSTFVWVTLAMLYVIALVVVGMTCLRRGHTVLFVLGIFMPLLWIIGALIAPTPRAVGMA